MPFDAHKNLAIATIATAPSPSTSGTTLTVAAGEGARFPVPPFNATVWPATQPPTPVNAEVVRVTARAGDSLTITRAVESTTARAIVAGDLIAATITAKTLTDIESGTNFPLIATPGSVQANGQLIANNAVNPTGVSIRAVGVPVGTVNFLEIGNGNNVAYIGIERADGGHFGGGPNALILVSTGAGLTLQTGAASPIRFHPTGVERGRMHPSGGFSWGTTVDPGAGQVLLGAAPVAGNYFTRLAPGTLELGTTGTGAANVCFFQNGGGLAGYIQTSGSTTTYGTTSDARLKEDHGVLRSAASGDVLRATVVHDFTWKVDGTPGRGVFAQEAVTVAPFAVSVGTDETDDEGRLLHPWAVDYAKYVPDLIVGWQQLDAQMAALEAAQATQAALTARIAALEARLAALEAAPADRG